MSRVPGAVARTTLLDTLMGLHGALDVITENGVQAHLALSCEERAKLYHTASKKIRESLMIVEQALAQPPSNGSDSTTSIYQQQYLEE